MVDQEQREGMHYLESLPRRWVTVYIPLLLFLFFLLFPFYWMGLTAFKPHAELLSSEGNPFWVGAPTLEHFRKRFIASRARVKSVWRSSLLIWCRRRYCSSRWQR